MQQVIYYQQIIIPILKKFAIKRAAIFGSVAKGTDTRNSDLDLLIEPEKGFTLFKMLQLEIEIAELLKRKIDVVEYDAIKPSLQNEILASAIRIL